MSVTVILGTQWGDEGKGKAIDTFAGDFDFVARFNGGNNAGHTIVNDEEKLYPKSPHFLFSQLNQMTKIKHTTLPLFKFNQ